MSNAVNKIKKDLEKKKQEQATLFDNISLTVYGSLILSIQALVPGLRTTEEEFIERFKEIKLPYMNDPDFMKKTVDTFYQEGTYDDWVVGLPLAVFEGEKNTLFAIVYDDKVWPYRRDGFLPSTILKNEPKIIDWSKENKKGE